MLLLLVALASFPPMTRDLTGADPGTWEEWMSEQPDPVSLVVEPLIIPGGRATNFAVLMEEGLSDSLMPGTLERWAADMTPWVGGVLVAEITYSTPEELRAWLLTMHGQGLAGVVLVGDLPVAWVMMDDAFTREGETFPCDYFLMDLDGSWQDNWIGYPSAGVPGQDGRYDTWDASGMAPEIYCSRMKTSNTTIGSEGELLQAYLDRNHEWRTIGDSLPLQALCYVDNDWAVWGAEFRDAMMRLYPVVELINDLEQTCGTDYETNRLPAVYQWISPFVHSSPLLHQWNPGPDTRWDEVHLIDPPARFYNLFACSNSRFTTPRNMGSMYVFGTTHGLASVGSTKTGSMLSFEPFYQALGDGGSLGQAFVAWWQYIIGGGFTASEMSWHMGMVLIGDPTLVPVSLITGIEGDEPSPEAEFFTILGNPCSGTLRVSVLEGAGGAIRVLDTAGRVVVERAASPGEVSLDLDGLPSGIYILLMQDPRSDGTAQTGRFTLL